ncbi:Paf1 complex component [Malassezia sp. CBS 17886]|nr:Paf1 complex component [Malassezia sp. CBS 17886]
MASKTMDLDEGPRSADGGGAEGRDAAYGEAEEGGVSGVGRGGPGEHPLAAPIDLADALFGDDEEEEEEAVVRPAAPTHAPAEDMGASSDSDSLGDADAEKAALEYLEDEDAPPAPIVEEQTAWLSLAHPPVRRTKPMLLARLPNFMRWQDVPFAADTWDEHEEEDTFAGDNAPASIGDRDARSLVRTANTVRWRWSRDGKTPESNARIVRWSDGSESLQLGSEFFELSSHAEPSTEAADGERVPLTYCFVPHPDEGVLQAEAPVRSTVSFKPNLRSDTHAKLARAIKHHRHARVVAGQEMFGTLDPERQKERIERQLKEAERKKHRERVKALRESADYDGDLDFSSRRNAGGARSRGSRSYVTDWSDDDEAPARGRHADYDDDDGFIVQDDDEEAVASEDDIDRAERDMEEQEKGTGARGDGERTA